jgi:hypothetical protein
MDKIHKAYINLVKRNYMYQHGDVIKITNFDSAVSDILFPKTDKPWLIFSLYTLFYDLV